MRNKLTIWTAALLCSASLANAQPQEAAPATPGAVTGVIDFGFRGGALEDDYARYERYRDLRDGAFSRINFGQEKETYNWSAGARNIGYRDQFYFANFTNGKSHAFGGEFLELVPSERLRYTDVFDDPNLPGQMQVTITLRKVACG